MKLHRWTIKEIEVLKLMYPCYTAKEIGAYFGVSIGSVTAMAFRLGMNGVKRKGRPRMLGVK